MLLGAAKAFELLNFGVPGYQPPQQIVNFERAMRLQPNVLFYVRTGRERGGGWVWHKMREGKRWWIRKRNRHDD